MIPPTCNCGAKGDRFHYDDCALVKAGASVCSMPRAKANGWYEGPTFADAVARLREETARQIHGVVTDVQPNTEASGGTRYSTGKPKGWWYAPLYGLRLVAQVWEAGASKYAPRDWAEGQSFSTLLDCASRHWLEVMHRGPWAIDEDTGAYHLANLAWNVLCLLTFMALDRRDLDDVTPWFGVTADRRAEVEEAIARQRQAGPAKRSEPPEPTYPG